MLFNTSLHIFLKTIVVDILKSNNMPGLRMRFSFHTPDDEPERLPEKLLDCSSSNFIHYVVSNFIEECEPNVDETDCELTSAAECHGGFAYGDSCFKQFSVSDRLSWAEARLKCNRDDADFPSFQTADKSNTVWVFSQGNGIYPIGLRSPPASIPVLYRDILYWVSGQPALDLEYTIAFGGMPVFDPKTGRFSRQTDLNNHCGGFGLGLVGAAPCHTPEIFEYMCEYSVSSRLARSQIRGVTLTNISDHVTFQLPSPVKCAGSHVTHDFLSCDPDLACKADEFVYTCETGKGGPAIPMFTCHNGWVTSSYTVTCDHHDDCGDGSDEDWCVFEPCRGFQCHDFECVDLEQVCDGVNDCKQREDESDCPKAVASHTYSVTRAAYPSIIDLDGLGHKTIRDANITSGEKILCPSTHFECPSWHCLPVFLRCNGVKDCPNGEDEVDCKPAPPCPGYYRCRHSPVCLHPQNVCDGVYHCPLRDDEQFCNLTCPEQCRCQGLAFVCPAPFPTHLYPQLRYLDASGSGMGVANLTDNSFLVSLVLHHCGLDLVSNVTLPNLRSLDLSHNQLTSIILSQFNQLTNLVNLTLSWNPVRQVLVGGAVSVHTGLNDLHLVGLKMDKLTVDAVSEVFPSLTMLNVSGGEFHAVGAFSSLYSLELLDLTESPVLDFPSDVFKGMSKLREVRADNYRLCCRQIVPETLIPARCLAPVDEVSSCDDLLRAPIYRIFLWIFGLVAVIGNVFSFAVRCFVQKNASKTGFGVFVTHLSLSDLLMGIYLTLIGVPDLMFRGSYLWEERQWKQSVACQLAGFLSFLSNEVSALIVCLITLDRFLVLRFPFSQRRFGSRSATMACAVAWLTGLLVAAVPLFPVLSHWDFYGQTGICIPLPITRKQFAGQGYSFAIMIVANFILFILIALGQVGVFTSIRANAMSSDNYNNDDKNTGSSNSRSRDLAIAQRLAVIVITDFMCWFPVGLLGLLVTLGDVPISGEAGVAVAIFVLPLNSALNPFLYTLNVVLAKRAKRRENELLRVLEAKVRSQMSTASTTASTGRQTTVSEQVRIAVTTTTPATDKI